MNAELKQIKQMILNLQDTVEQLSTDLDALRDELTAVEAQVFDDGK